MTAKLYYFNARGLCEPIRLILAYGELEYEDIRSPMPEMNLHEGFKRPVLIPEIKEKCRWQQVPIMEFDGKILAQSNAIARYWAKQFNLVGKDDFEAAQCDEYADCAREILTTFVPVFIIADEEKRKEAKEQVRKTMDEKFLKTLNSIVKANGGERLVGKSLTWADITLAHVIRNVEMVGEMDISKYYPALKTLCETVFNVPQIKKWVENRPVTKF